MTGRYTLFSRERLFGFLNTLDRKVTVQVTRRRKGESLQEVVLDYDLIYGLLGLCKILAHEIRAIYCEKNNVSYRPNFQTELFQKVRLR